MQDKSIEIKFENDVKKNVNPGISKITFRESKKCFTINRDKKLSQYFTSLSITDKTSVDLQTIYNYLLLFYIDFEAIN